MFETKFEIYTENKWSERLFFISKPGKYQILSEEKEKERLEIAKTAETEVTKLLAPYINKQGDQLDQFLKFVWSIDLAKKAMKDMSLDVAKLPLGVLKIERVRKSLQILAKILKQIQVGGSLTAAVEQKVAELTSEFYSVLPYDFGTK